MQECHLSNHIKNPIYLIDGRSEKMEPFEISGGKLPAVTVKLITIAEARPLLFVAL
jgi:hypothetical protein